VTTPDQPGWYDDPSDSNAQRYWDGQNWTPHRQRKPKSRPASPSATPAQPPPSPPTLVGLRPPLPPTPGLSPPPPPAPARPPEPPPTQIGPPPPMPGLSPARTPSPPPGVPWGPPPQGQPAPYPQTGAVFGDMASQNPPAVKGMVVKLSVTAVLLFGGFIIATIAIFFPWVTVSANFEGISLGSYEGGLTGGWRFADLLVIAGAAWLAWPTLSGSQMPVNRLAGLTVVVCLLVGVFAIGFYDVVFSGAPKEVDVSPGFGLLLYTAAVISSVAGVVRLWIQRGQNENRA
jgi:Protein of unknown function (DUF2510)